MLDVINGNADAFAALAHAEFSGQIDLIAELVFLNQLLKALNNGLGAQQVAGAAHANGDLHSIFLPVRKLFSRL